MNELFWIILGIACGILTLIVVYFAQLIIRLYSNKKKIKNTLIQIRGQVNLKHELLKEYIEMNKDLLDQDVYNNLSNKISSYNFQNENDVETIKIFSEFYSVHLNNFNDSLLIKQCEESDSKINHIKDYYNELVHGFNQYKSHGVNYYFSKIMSIKDEKLY